ncbi:TonB-dependent receptor [Sphingobium sp.]|uniref:TonB-dependent receptor n=1 Tax=Sphingobium sp. TaxID=1912891 RepID=UPI003BB6F057
MSKFRHIVDAPHALLAFAILSGAPGTAIAQNQPNPEASERLASNDILVIGRTDLGLNMPVETGSRLGLTPLEMPASVSTVDGDAIRARGDLTVAEAVSRAPGIANISNQGDGGTALAARGFAGQGSVLQLVDGVRQFPVNGTITFPSDPWNVDRIEVLTGPASVLYGQGALGGAINVITKKPSDRQVVDLQAGYGSQNTAHLAAGAGGSLGDMFGYRVDASYRRSDGYVDRGRSNSIAIGGEIAFTPNDDLSVTFRADYARKQPMRYWGTPLVGGRIDDRIRDRNYEVLDGTIRYIDDRETLTVKWSPSDAVTVQNTSYRLGTKRTWYSLDLYCYIETDGNCGNGLGSGTPGKVYRADNVGIIHDSQQFGNQGSVSVKTPLGNAMSNDFVLGFDVNYIKHDYSHNFDFSTYVDEVDPFNFDPGYLENRDQTLPRYRTRTREWAIFGEDRLKFSERLSLVGGFRYEEDRVKRSNFVYTNGVITGTVNAFPGGATQKKFTNFTWRVGAVYQPTPTLSLYGQYATGVDPIGTLTSFTTNATQFLFTNAKGDQIEVGVKASFMDGRGAATLSAYRIVKTGLAAQRVTNGPIEQIGKQASKGIEASLSLLLFKGFGIEANGTVLDAKYRDFISGNVDLSGNTPFDVPESAANLWLTWEGKGGLRAQAGLRYVGRRYTDTANLFRIPSYTVIDAGVSYALTENIAVDLRALNLFDKDYAVSAYNNEQWVLGRPRSVDVAIRARF